MIEIICQGKSPSEAKAKCLVAEILLTEKIISADMTIKVLNGIGGVYIAERENWMEKALKNVLVYLKIWLTNDTNIKIIKEINDAIWRRSKEWQKVRNKNEN